MKRQYFTRSRSANNVDSGTTSSGAEKRSKQGKPARERSRRKDDAGTSAKNASKNEPEVSRDPSPESDANEVVSAPSSSSKVEKWSMITVDALPDKILVQIFESLSVATRIRIERVCRRWNYMARCYSWSGTRKLDYLVVADGYLGGFGGFGIHDVDSDSDDEFILNRRLGLHGCRAILSRPRLTNDSLRQVLDRAGGYLTSIDLSGYRDIIDYRVLRNIGQQCPNLESINCTGILVTNTSLLSLATGCRRLKSITFQRCFHDSIVDRGLSSVLFGCRELVSLNLSENERVSGACFDQLPATLRHLNVSACYGLGDEAMRAIADRCQSLQVLHLDCCDRLSLNAITYAFNHLSQLTVLRMSEFYVFGDVPSAPAVTAMQTLNKLTQLTTLYMNNNYLIDDTVICAVARECPLLESLDISGGNKAITDHALISLGRFANRTLKRLNLNYLSRITNVGVKSLSQCTKLQTLLLHRCDEVGDDGVMELAKHCHELRQLDVSFCHNVTNASVLTFAKERGRNHRKLLQQARKRTDAKKSTSVSRGDAGRGGSQTASEQRRRKFKPPNGGIIMFVGATMVTSNLPRNRFVKLAFRDVMGYWPDDPWD